MKPTVPPEPARLAASFLCPFCGEGRLAIKVMPDVGGETYEIATCDECGAEGPARLLRRKMNAPAAPPTSTPITTPFGVKVERSKEWWLARADAEGDSPVTAGAPAAPPTVAPAMDVVFAMLPREQWEELDSLVGHEWVEAICEAAEVAIERDRASRSPGHDEALERAAVLVGALVRVLCDTPKYALSEFDVTTTLPLARRWIETASALRGEGPSPAREGKVHGAPLSGLDAATVGTKGRGEP